MSERRDSILKAYDKAMVTGVDAATAYAEARKELFTGRKDDAEKLRYDLIPPSTLKALATILTFGAKKYSDRNWEAGIKWGRVFGALMRHLWAWWAREEGDPETGKSHLWHAQCCLSFLIEYETTHREMDDRPMEAQCQLPFDSPTKTPASS